MGKLLKHTIVLLIVLSLLTAGLVPEAYALRPTAYRHFIATDKAPKASSPGMPATGEVDVANDDSLILYLASRLVEQYEPAGRAGALSENLLLEIACTLVRQKETVLPLLRKEGALSEAACEVITDGKVENVDIFAKEAAALLRGYRQHNLPAHLIEKLCATQPLPAQAVLRIQRVYQQGKDYSLLIEALDQPRPERYIRQRLSDQKPGGLDERKHLRRYTWDDRRIKPEKEILKDRDLLLYEFGLYRRMLRELLNVASDDAWLQYKIMLGTVEGMLTHLERFPYNPTTGRRPFDYLFKLAEMTTSTGRERLNESNVHNKKILEDKAQRMAVNMALDDNEITFIDGPPGTGKTTVIAEIIYQYVKRGKRVLLVSQMHHAVNTALDGLLKIKDDEFKKGEFPAFRFANDPKSFRKEYPDIERVWMGNRRSVRIGEIKDQGVRDDDVQVLLRRLAEKGYLEATRSGRSIFYDVTDKIHKFRSRMGTAGNFREEILEKGNAADPLAYYDAAVFGKILILLKGIDEDVKKKRRGESQEVTERLNSLLIQEKGHAAAITNMATATDHLFKRYINTSGVSESEIYDTEGGFDLLVMDETSREILCGGLLPPRCLKQNGKMVFVFDQRQLPPHGLKDRERDHLLARGFTEQDIEQFIADMLTGITTRYQKDAKIRIPPPGEDIKLLTNYRSVSIIGKFVSKMSYDGELLCRGWEDYDQDTIRIVDIAEGATTDKYERKNSEGSSYNRHSAQEVLKLVEYYNRKYTTPGPDRDGRFKLSDITIITPYQAQVALIRRELIKIYGKDAKYIPHVTTIDAYQGGENKVIIFDSVRSNPKGKIGFLKDRRRLNVAMSRAKKNLAMVWDSRTTLSPISDRDDPEDKIGKLFFRDIQEFIDEYFSEDMFAKSSPAGTTFDPIAEGLMNGTVKPHMQDAAAQDARIPNAGPADYRGSPQTTRKILSSA
ncbi:MAG: AAA family ATPase [Candidatus Omnitrophica bacterium]|nr:AAA family ATPase [Candidatus Omnitrophota bacterium]